MPDVESSAPGYADRFSGPIGEWFLQRQATITLEALPVDPNPLQIIDVGGGHAQLVPEMVRVGHEIVVYGSPEASRERILPWLKNPRCRFVGGDLLRLPFGDGCFDVAVCIRLLPHITGWRELIAELCRVSARAVILEYPSRRSLNLASRLLFPLKRRIESDTRPYALFPPRLVRRAFRAGGFTVKTARPQFLLPMVLHRAMGVPRVARVLETPGRVLGLTRIYGSPVIVRAERDAG